MFSIKTIDPLVKGEMQVDLFYLYTAKCWDVDSDNEEVVSACRELFLDFIRMTYTFSNEDDSGMKEWSFELELDDVPANTIDIVANYITRVFDQCVHIIEPYRDSRTLPIQRPVFNKRFLCYFTINKEIIDGEILYDFINKKFSFGLSYETRIRVVTNSSRLKIPASSVFADYKASSEREEKRIKALLSIYGLTDYRQCFIEIMDTISQLKKEGFIPVTVDDDSLLKYAVNFVLYELAFK